MPLLLGCIADDFTGATDLASTLVKGGMTAVQVIGVPDGPCRGGRGGGGAEVAHRAAGRRWRRAWPPARRCWRPARGRSSSSTAPPSTARSGQHRPGRGRAGAAAGLRLRAGEPAFPTNGRTVYQGHLFVGSSLLNESGMETTR
jgi:hypothetical protein